MGTRCVCDTLSSNDVTGRDDFLRQKEWTVQEDTSLARTNVPGHAQVYTASGKARQTFSRGARMVVKPLRRHGHVEYFCKAANRQWRQSPTHANPRAAWRLQSGDVFAYIRKGREGKYTVDCVFHGREKAISER